MKILILSGPQGSGKTTLQNALTENWFRRHHRKAQLINFADPIRKMADAVNFILHDHGWPFRGITKDGPLMQLLGTEWGRGTIDDDIWIKLLRTKIERAQALRSIVVECDGDINLIIIGDCRFPNEFEAFPDALRVRLVCQEHIRKRRCEMWRDNVNHPSETALNLHSQRGDFDMYLDTETTPVDGCVSLLTVALEKGDWVERRSQKPYDPNKLLEPKK